jgi:hypothetical protein
MEKEGGALTIEEQAAEIETEKDDDGTFSQMISQIYAQSYIARIFNYLADQIAQIFTAIIHEHVFVWLAKAVTWAFLNGVSAVSSFGSRTIVFGFMLTPISQRLRSDCAVIMK